MTAGADWISDAQVEAFGRRPDGPIMPSSHIVLRSVRLLESYGMDENGKPFISPVTNGPELPVVQVAANRAGECFLLARCASGYVMDTYELEAPNPQTILHFGTYGHETARGHEIATYDLTRASILGFTAEGVPVMSQWSSTLEKGEAPRSFTGVWQGDQLMEHESTSPWESVGFARVSYDGTILSTLRNVRDHAILRNGKVVAGSPPNLVSIDEMAATANGEIFTLSRPHSKVPYSLLPFYDAVWQQPLVVGRGAELFDLLSTRLGVVVIGSDYRRVHAYVVESNIIGGHYTGTVIHLHDLGPKDEYRRGYTPLSETDCAYVRRSRDGMEQWAFRLGGEGNAVFSHGPSFDRVSELFRHGDAFHYWAVADRYLHLVKIPDVPASNL
ncbi:MAG: hypothetical protein AAB413_03850 [Patescibacteria group bacterium]